MGEGELIYGRVRVRLLDIVGDRGEGEEER